MTEDGYEIRAMSRPDMDLMMDWAAAEGWNPGLGDADAFRAADPNGFLMGVLEGAPIASISGVAYEGGFGFLGFYIVVPAHRGKGYGLRLWNACMDYLKGRDVGLDGVVAQQHNYRKSGYRLAHSNYRYEGIGRAAVADGVIPVDLLPFARLEAYDRTCFPAPRRAFLQAWLAMEGASAFAALRDGDLAGYGVIRPCRSGFKIGPLFADDEAIAETLFTALSAHAPGAPIFLDITDINPAAKALATRHGMTPIFETARMYTGPMPELVDDKIFGITTFELG